MNERALVFENVFNFRDLGGYRGADGRTVRWGRLFRADDLCRLDDADLARLGELGVRTVIDLRRPDEIERHGRTRISHPNVERTDLRPEPRLAELGNLLGKGFLLPAPILPRKEWRSALLPTPMARSQRGTRQPRGTGRNSPAPTLAASSGMLSPANGRCPTSASQATMANAN